MFHNEIPPHVVKGVVERSPDYKKCRSMSTDFVYAMGVTKSLDSDGLMT